jgi:hypothetical protein
MSRNEVQDIELKPSALAAGLGIACLPFAALTSCWVLNPRTEGLVLHFGVPSELHSEEGCQLSNPYVIYLLFC